MSGVVVVKNDFRTAGIKLEVGKKVIVANSAQRIASAASSAAPRLTGALAGSIRASSTGEVTADIRYAGYVEDGTNDTPAQPYFYPSVDSEAPKLEAEMAALLKSLE